MKNKHDRFGQHPDDSQELVQAWAATQPQVPVQQWVAFWGDTLVKSAALGGSTDGGTTSGMAGRWIKLGLAASLAGLAWANWPQGQVDPKGPEQVAQSTPVAETVVSINLDEADAVAIIRLDDAQCPAESPCLDTVEPISADSAGAALASNFQLFNDLESLAGE